MSSRQPLKRLNVKEEQRFASVKRLLKDLNYNDFLSVDSLDLADKLITDHVQILENLKQTESKLEAATKDVVKMQRETDPLKKDLARALRERQDLDEQVVRLKEALLKKEDESAGTVRKLEAKINEQVFIISQHTQRALQLESELEASRDRIEELTDRNFTHVVTEAGDFRIRGQEMERKASASAPSASLTPRNSTPSPNVDLVLLTERQLKEAVAAHDRAQQEITLLRAQLEEARSSSRGERGGSRVGPGEMEKAHVENLRIVERQREQLDFITSQLVSAEQKIREFEAVSQSQASVSARVEQAEEALRLRERELARVTSELTNSEKTRWGLDEECRALRDKIEEIQEERDRYRDQMETLNDRLMGIDNSTNPSAELSGMSSEQLRYRAGQLERERDLQLKKMQALVVVYDEKTHSYDQLRRNFDEVMSDRQQLLAQLDSLGQQLSSQKEMRANAIADLTESKIELARADANVSRLSSECDSLHARLRDLIEKNRVIEKRILEAQVTSAEAASLQRAVTSLEAELKSKSDLVVSLEEEIRRYENGDASVGEALALRDQGLRELEARLAENEKVVARATEDKAVMQDLLKHMHPQIQKFQESLLQFADERDAALAELQDQKVRGESQEREIESLRDQTESLVNRIRELEGMLDATAEEKDHTESKLHQISVERSTWQSQREAFSQLESTSQSQIDGMREEMAAIRDERDGVILQLKNLHGKLEGLVKVLEERGAELDAATGTISQKQREIEEMQELIGQMERTQFELTSQLRGYMSQAGRQDGSLSNLQMQISELKQINSRLEEERNRARYAVEALSENKDTLCAQLDTKDEDIAKMRRQIEELEGRVEREKIEGMANSQQIHAYTDSLSLRDAEIASMKRALETEGAARMQLVTAKENLEIHSAALANDLNVVTKENQTITAELNSCVAERNHILAEFQAAMKKVGLAEQVVRARERENEDLLHNYRALNEEKQRLQNNFDKLSLDLQSANSLVANLKEALTRAEGAIQQYSLNETHMHEDIVSLEAENNRLGGAISHLQREIEIREERVSMSERERDAVANMHAALQVAHNDRQRQLAILSEELERGREALRRCVQENESGQQSLQIEKQHVRELEGVCQMLRSKEHSQFLSEQNKNQDISDLKQQLHLAESEHDQMVAEHRILQTKFDELEFELSKMRRLAAEESKDKNTYSAELNLLRQKVHDGTMANKQLQGRVQSHEEERVAAKLRLDKALSENAMIEAQLMESQQTVRNHESALRALEDSLRRAQLERSEAADALARSQAQLNRLKDQQMNIHSSSPKAEESPSKLEKLKAENTKLYATLKGLEHDHFELEKKYQQLLASEVGESTLI